jgi:hypothetical protein
MRNRLQEIKTKGLEEAGIRLKGMTLPANEKWRGLTSFKGLNHLFSDDIKTESKSLRESIYWDWYQSIRLSKIVWFSQTHNALPKDKAMAKVCKDFGSAITQGVFVVWAMKYARSLFAETKSFDLVSRFDPANPPEDLLTDDHLILAIPLTVPRAFLVPQILNFLGEYHPGRDLNVIETAHTAQYKLHTLRYRRHVLEIERLVFLYKTLYPEAPLWLIADRLQLAPNNRVRDDRFIGLKKGVYNRLNSIGGRHLFKARRRILNAERGVFPSSNEVIVGSRVQPFGRKINDEYLMATEISSQHSSEWVRWLHHEYHGMLVREVLNRNRYDRDRVILESVVDFLSGKKNTVSFRF